MVEKGWNKHYKIDITLKVNKDKKPEGLKCMGLSPVFLKKSLVHFCYWSVNLSMLKIFWYLSSLPEEIKNM